MGTIEILNKEKFKEVYTNEELRNAVAFSHGCLDGDYKFLHNKALMYLISYKVTESQIKECVALRLKKQREVLIENKHNLLFCAMGMNFKPTFKDGVGNHRIRTTFINCGGVKCFIEVGKGREDNLRVDFSIFDYEKKDNKGYDNYKDLERKTPSLKYTYKNVLKLVNAYFDCNFKKIIVDYYNINPDVICKSPKD